MLFVPKNKSCRSCLNILQLAQLHYLLDSCCQTILVLTTSLSIVWLTTATALDELGSLTDNLSGIEVMFLDHILREHHAKHWLVVGNRANHADEMLWDSLTNLEYKVLS